MKSLLILLTLPAFLLIVKPAMAAGDTCNAKCDVNEDCGKGYKCYVGVCRAIACASSTTCSCSVTATPVASATPIAQVIVSAAPVSKATPATTSATVKKAPKTGVSAPVLLLSALMMAAVGFKLQSLQV